LHAAVPRSLDAPRQSLQSDNRSDNITAMVTHPREHLVEAMAGLCEPLHEHLAMAAADVSAVRARLDLTASQYNYAVTHLTRARLHRLLSREDLGRWRVNGRHGANGPLWLHQGMMTLRVLHASAGEVPAPGSSERRRAYYRNAPLFELGEQAMIPALNASNYLGLWSVDRSGQPTVRIVRPIGSWNYGSNERVDVDFLLPEIDEELERLEFVPTDDEIRLDIPDEEEGTEGGDDLRG
jgi:hypothetical protein